ncbi:16S rRNA (guanine(966)-N(2))-methyltransferase RsmD [Rickettsiella grylli]|uniref:Ribosomal RNA small subunit methyltransferase D n=1 Tax=Rickettsiella grylli TaxID=59196 RepID=A8PM12_9COXI|nr:16S rRNA (guanine(966)-N(2))-methyltransferase RsmD [Rickettsiella grylli]EDP45813.1 putative methyltransferase [Rickettsiella grylli]
MKKGEIRIIGGQWRGRKLQFPALFGLRPTPNRVRETLFNWLAHDLVHAHCLDLFAGSGALGFEALSRHVQSVTFIEQSAVLVSYLKTQLRQFSAENRAHVYQKHFPFDASRLFQTKNSLFNIVFLDPPFYQNWLDLACAWLLKEQLLAKDAKIYIESKTPLKRLKLPENWCLQYNKTAGQVHYGLIQSNV